MQQEKEQQEVQKKQAIRKQRLAMAFASYIVPFLLMLLCWHLGLIPVYLVLAIVLTIAAVHAFFLYLINSGLNLRLKEPSLTAPQMTVSAVLAVVVMYFLEPGQARASFMMMVAIPSIYGILALNIKRFLRICAIFVVLYLAMMTALWIQKPQILNPALELIQAVAFVLVMGSIALVGGFISQLRAKVRTRNRELQQAVERIEELVNIDSLTGVCNRRRLFDVLDEESSRYNRGREPFSVCIADIDHFKQINDTYGHLAGDEILCRIAGSISENIRAVDTFGRYGGEEFLLVMPYTPLSGAQIKAERVRRQVEELDLSDISPGLKITVSAGVAEYREGEKVDSTLVRADDALYTAKESGRNRVATEKDL